jgi:membrane-bound serine protease (ClpP class)
VGTILLLAGVGFLLLLTEMFLPGGVLGVLGSLLLLAAIVVGYMQLGAMGGSVLLCVILVCVLVGFCVGMAIFPRTPTGRKMILGRALVSGDVLTPSASLVGSEGLAITTLRPAGKAMIDGRRMDVVAEGDFIEADTEVVVTAGEGARIVVRKKA